MGDPIVGRVLDGRYRVKQSLARGGMSTVYTGLDERLDREVAIKVMSSALSTDPAFADRFTREARVAARLSHPNAVSVYDQGTDAGHVFLIMELVRGRTLRDLLRERGALSPALAVSLMEPVLGALAAAHRAGLVHRDVKPENILLSDDGAVKVADFGLARAIEADASNTRTGLMMGTVAYCPPEQISRGHADARSDVYSAGVVLFELLTGTAPYTGDSAMSVAYQHVNSTVPLPSSRRAGIPTPIDDLVRRATSREPSGRPLDAGAFLAELHDIRLDLALPVVGVPPRRPAADPNATQIIPTAAADYPGPPGARHTAESATAPTHGGRPPARGNGTAVSRRPGVERTPSPSRDEARRRAMAERRRRARLRSTVIVLVILLLGLATGYGAWWLTVGRYRSVPNVTGLSASAATQTLRDKGFAVSSAVRQQYSEQYPAGQIIATDPGASSHQLKGQLVTLVLSKGAERYTIPDVAGKKAADAAKAFSGMPLNVVDSQQADGTGKVDKGTVIGTNPPKGSEVKRNANVTIFVSSGPPAVTVPDVQNQKKDDATKALTDAGFQVTVQQDYSDSVPDGSVISQTPGAKSSALKFSSVTIVVSKGPELVTLPKIKNGTDANEAKQTLESLGLVVSIDTRYGGFLNKVVGMDPKAGTQVRRGDTVTLTVV
ncbi:Stk1 family PASTA domain-containing Ser/Thr kinase [Jatrophihabitans telluris]|uniref:non-specific serine/threonine protein kinase n=1 Tax=Jatrophihabitans telluris TaxID=2038343 RepID=A0ABY4QVV1_9ACTN|nr:Stk1 family PASTA domain-containing Ser/Thr kinase [Jatrophihabitans telluris]UQX87222.1 Stk1 family PASTA domain-containing Ser/Thr kinase [Jatrophihabitans telluris]